MTRTLDEAEMAWLRRARHDPAIGVRDIYARLRLGGSTLMRLRDELGLGPMNGGLTYRTRRARTAGPASLPPAVTVTVTPEYEAMLRRVAAWDGAAARGLAVLEAQRRAA